MDWLTRELAEIRSKGLYRETRAIETAQTPRIKKDGREYILLSSNNYLGLATHPEIKRSAIEAIEKYGSGAGGSRLTTGNTDLYEQLEKKIADFKGTDDAIVFGSGYMANIGTISALMNAGDLLLSDELNHASIIDGCRLSRADVRVYPHRDVTYIKKELRASKNLYGSKTRKKLIVTDGIFSMDGDIAPLPEIIEIAEKYDAMVMVDDAHATGILGKHGRGTGEHFNVEPDITMGTFSKALASSGGYIAGESELIDYLRNRARTFIFSTALAPPDVATAGTAIDIIRKENPSKKLWGNVAIYKKGLIDAGLDIKSETQIIPLMTGDTETTHKVASELEKLGIFVQGIRPPTVPEGKGRIRTTLMATHSRKDIDDALHAIRKVKEKFNIS